MKRCKWAEKEEMKEYHDKEWGVPLHDDNKLFEALILDGAQAGLSWSTILKKREGYRKAFNNFDPKKVVKYSDKDRERLINNPDIIRNRLKIDSAISNAKIFLEVQKEFGTFDKYIWSFTNYKVIKNKYKSMKDLPATSEISDRLSKDLKKRGFKFVGSTICYAMMQAIGMINDHEISCFRYNEI